MLDGEKQRCAGSPFHCYREAVLVARGLGGDRYPPVHLGKGVYQFPYRMKYPGMAPLEFDGPSIHIYQPVDQAWRGVNDGAAAQALIGRHAGPGWAVQEFGLYGPVAARYAPGNPKGRADVLVVSPDGQHTAYEIKTQGDSLGRLPMQVPLYTHTFARCVLVVTPRHLPGATAILPEAWGIMVLDPDTHGFSEVVREAQTGGGIMGAELALLELWGHEIRALAKPLEIKCGPAGTRPPQRSRSAGPSTGRAVTAGLGPGHRCPGALHRSGTTDAD